MRVVTWNMGCGPSASQYRKSHDEAWDYLLRELQPDVALVQEALVTKIHDARREHSVSLCEIGPNVAAGTAVLVRGFGTQAAPTVAVSPHTYAATTEINTPAGPLTVASVRSCKVVDNEAVRRLSDHRPVEAFAVPSDRARRGSPAMDLDVRPS